MFNGLADVVLFTYASTHLMMANSKSPMQEKTRDSHSTQSKDKIWRSWGGGGQSKKEGRYFKIVYEIRVSLITLLLLLVLRV